MPPPLRVDITLHSRPLLCAAAFGFGAVASLGWPPVDIAPFAIGAYGMLFVMLSQLRSAAQAALCGLAFGVGLHLFGDGWAYRALHQKAGLDALPAALSAGFFIVYLAAFLALPCATYVGLRRRMPGLPPAGIRDALVYGASLTLGEWARTLFWNGFSGHSLGYALIDTWLAGFGPLAGLHGISMTGFVLAALLMILPGTMLIASPSCRSRDAIRPAHALRAAGVGIAIISAGWTLQHMTWVVPHGPALSYRLIQSSIDDSDSLDSQPQQRRAQRVAQSMQQAPATLIVTGETAFPLPLHALPNDILPALQTFARDTGSHLFLGLPISGAQAQTYNSIVMIAPSHPDSFARYDKVRLMPFGEYAPAGWSWFTRSLALPRKDLSAGNEDVPPFSISHGDDTLRVGALICHEESFGADARARALVAHLLIDASNLSWFRGTSALVQTLEIARMRALETGRPLLRAANAGITAHIDASGRVRAQLAADEEGELRGSIQGTTGLTPFDRWGNGPVLSLAGAILATAFMRLIRTPRTRG